MSAGARLIALIHLIIHFVYNIISDFCFSYLVYAFLFFLNLLFGFKFYYIVNIIISASYDEARKKLVDAEFTSTLETDV